MLDEAALIEKLQRIEALFAGATTVGERKAADAARERMLALLEAAREVEQPVEYRFTLGDMWSRRLFVALLRRYSITPYRYPRQRHTTVMARVPRSFVDETLWPEFKELSATLQSHLDEVTNRVIEQSMSSDASEAEVREGASPIRELGG